MSPMSTSCALGNHSILGVRLEGNSIENLERNRECAINLHSSS